MAPILTRRNKPVAIVIGAGRGIGSSIAQLFASNGFDIGLIARKSTTLIETSREISDLSPNALVVVDKGDGADPSSLVAALETLKAQLGAPTVVFYNIGSFGSPGSKYGPRPLEEYSTELFAEHLTVSVTSAFTVAQWASKNIITGEHKAAIMFTGGGLSMHPVPEYAGLSAAKAALHNVNLSFHDVLKPKGIHVAIVTVCGSVSSEDKKYSPVLIADEFFKLYAQQSSSTWEPEKIY